MRKSQKKLFILAPYTPAIENSWTYYRSELIAIEAIKSNFEVNLVCTNFDYRSKKFFTNKKDISSLEKFKKIRLNCGTFQKSIGLERIIFELRFGIKASKYLADNLSDESSLIVIDPCLVWFFLIRKLINERNIFLIIDILDLWPEALLTSFKSIFIKNLIKITFPFIKNLRYKIWLNADLITSCTQEYSELVKSKINRNANTFYIGSSLKPIVNKIYKNKEISNLGILLENKISVIYSGSYTNNYPIKYICEAINIILKQNFLEIVFIFCGDGNQKLLIQNLSKKFPNNVFDLGRLNKTDLNDIYNLSSIALNIYNKDSPVKMPL